MNIVTRGTSVSVTTDDLSLLPLPSTAAKAILLMNILSHLHITTVELIQDETLFDDHTSSAMRGWSRVPVPEQMSGCGVGAGGATREARRVCNLRTRCLHIQLSRSCCCKQKHISTKDQDHQQSPVTITGHHNLRPHHNRLLCMCATD